MARRGVELLGVGDTKKALEGFRDRLRPELQAVIVVTLGRVVEGAQKRAPKDTGQMASDISFDPPEGDKTVGYAGIRKGAPSEIYAPIVHYGWPARGIKPNGFMRKAGNYERKPHRLRLGEVIAEAVKRGNRRV